MKDDSEGVDTRLVEIRHALAVLYQPGDVVELRIINEGKYGATISGYFDDLDKLAQVIATYDGKVPAIYTTLNPCKRALLSRACNRARDLGKKDPTTADHDILSRRWLPIDADPIRPSGISSTKEEKVAAGEVARHIREALSARGWPEPIAADSGNGLHLVYAVDLPNDDAATDLVKRCLEALATQFNTDAAKVDTSVHNAARIWKVYGTLAKKGDSTAERPHRRSRLRHVPTTLEVVRRELLDGLAAMAPAQQAKAPPTPNSHSRPRPGGGDFDLTQWIDDHALDVKESKPWEGAGRIWVLDPCPFNPDHLGGTAFVNQRASGAIGAGCHHESCKWGWRDLRERYEPGCYDRPSRRAPSTPGEEGSTLTYLRTDGGNAERFADDHRGTVRHCHPWQDWLTYGQGVRWKRDTSGTAMHKAKLTTRNMIDEALALKDADPNRSAGLRWAIQSDSRSRREAMLVLARSEPGIPVLPEDLDRDPWLLNVSNGTINLRTGDLLPHDPERLITKLAPVDYDPTATAPTWIAFLERVLRDETVREFLQRYTGYCLTGDVREQILLFLYGPGANGKTTFVNAIVGTFGDYAQTAAPNLLVHSSGDRHPTEIADLMGARLVTTIEVQEGRRLAEELVKQLTGSDKIKGRYMRADFFQFDPTHKLVLVANHKPVVRGTDYAIWRRIRVVPFIEVIPEEERDPRLPEKLQAELPGILAWAVRGCLAWQRDGLKAPETVKAATDGYRAESDLVGRFLADRCLVAPHAGVKASAIYADFRTWCVSVGEREITQTMFGRRLSERGLKNERRSGATWWCGVGLFTDPGDEPPDARSAPFESDPGIPYRNGSPRGDNPKADSNHANHGGRGREPGDDDEFDRGEM